MRQSLIPAFVVLTLSACATPRVQSELDYLPEIWRQQSVCVGSWEELLDEWEAHGGGIRASLVETRRQIELDGSSRFAKLIRAAWKAQPEGVPISRAIGGVPEDQNRIATQAIYEQAAGVVASGCEVPIYLDNWWNRKLMERRPSDMPPSVPDDLWAQRNWLQAGIFVRVLHLELP